jgi:hypothetical protein
MGMEERITYSHLHPPELLLSKFPVNPTDASNESTK